MKYYKSILIILVLFLKTGNVLSNNNIFNVNNVEIEKKVKSTNEFLANQAIKKGFTKLTDKILLKEDLEKLKDLKFTEIKELVSYYQISNKVNDNINIEKITYSISFDKDKIHNLFYKKRISYSDITNKELLILPIFKKNNKIFIYNKNYFYDKWNKENDGELIEFILPLENIEVIQNINLNKDNLLKLELKKLFTEYSGKNLALVLIEDNNSLEEKIYLKTEILGKSIIKKIKLNRSILSDKEFYEKIIIKVKQELTYLIKSQNLIDITTPSFLKAQLRISKNSNLVILNSRLKKLDLIENIYIQEFNNKFVILKIKYLGKLDKMMKELENQKIILKLFNDQWKLEII